MTVLGINFCTLLEWLQIHRSSEISVYEKYTFVLVPTWVASEASKASEIHHVELFLVVRTDSTAILLCIVEIQQSSILKPRVRTFHEFQ